LAVNAVNHAKISLIISDFEHWPVAQGGPHANGEASIPMLHGQLMFTPARGITA
jgi:hypothetical protein